VLTGRAVVLEAHLEGVLERRQQLERGERVEAEAALGREEGLLIANLLRLDVLQAEGADGVGAAAWFFFRETG
jgi:hypothetical protein